MDAEILVSHTYYLLVTLLLSVILPYYSLMHVTHARQCLCSWKFCTLLSLSFCCYPSLSSLSNVLQAKVRVKYHGSEYAPAPHLQTLIRAMW